MEKELKSFLCGCAIGGLLFHMVTQTAFIIIEHILRVTLGGWFCIKTIRWALRELESIK